MARSGRTWRTGRSTAAARRSRHAATACATPAAPGLQHAHVLQPHPRLLGVGGARRADPELLAGVERPLQPAHRLELGDEHVLQLEQVGDVARGVRLLVVGERPAQPVGEPIALGGVDAELGLQQRGERRRAVAGEACGELRVEQARRHRPADVGQHVEVLLSGVQHGERLRVEEPSQRVRVDRERVDEDDLARPRQLEQRELREVGPLAMELGVHRVTGSWQRTSMTSSSSSPASPPSDGPRTAGPESSTSRPLITQAPVPPTTLTASMPCSARNSQHAVAPPADWQMTYTWWSGARRRGDASMLSGTVPIGTSRAAGHVSRLELVRLVDVDQAAALGGPCSSSSTCSPRPPWVVTSRSDAPYGF